MTRRRTLLVRTVAAASGAAGLVVGSGAYAPSDADWPVDVLATDDDTPRLPIVPSGVDSGAIRIDEETGELVVDAEGLPPNARVAYGRFEDIRDPTTLREEVFAVPNEIEPAETVDLTFGIAFASDPDADIYLAVTGSGSTVAVASTAGNEATVHGVPPGDEAVGGFIVDTAGPETFEATLSVAVVPGE